MTPQLSVALSGMYLYSFKRPCKQASNPLNRSNLHLFEITANFGHKHKKHLFLLLAQQLFHIDYICLY